MNRMIAAIVVGAVFAVWAMVSPVAAQPATAEVRTWSGQTYQVTEPALEVTYTILIKKGDGAEPSETAPTTGARTPMLFGTASSIGRFLDRSPDPLQGNRHSDALIVRKDGTEVRVPIANLASLTFARQSVRSALPPYVASEHYRYSAVATLNDGSKLEADYVNLGAASLRGGTAHGRIDIPWQQIESVRFTR